MSGIAAMMAPVGPIAEAFVNDWRKITGIMGPVGSAKTTSCIRKIITAALKQNPGPDGVRRVRGAAIRNTYPQLERNVLKSWFGWFPKDIGKWNGKNLVHELNLNWLNPQTGETIRIYIEMHFIALNERSAEEVLRGLELTLIWINEADTVDPSVYYFGMTRIGRYPDAKLGGCAWSGIIMDFNAPDIDNWVYDLFVDNNLGLDAELEAELRAQLGPLFGVGFYRQPGGRSVDPPPENLANLPPGYYLQQVMALSKKPNMLRRMVDNEFGTTVDGQPVYPEYNPGLHYAGQRLAPLSDYPIYVGIDGGRTPAAVFFQVPGYLRLLSEVVIYDPKKTSSGENIYLDRLGPAHFGELMREHVLDHFGDREVKCVFYDPSIDFGQEEDSYEWLRVLKAEFPCKYKAGGDAANRVEPRLEAMRHWFNSSPGGQPGVLVGSDCPVLRRALSGGYILVQRKTSTGLSLSAKPDKGPFSHVANAIEHGVLGYKMRGSAIEGQRQDRDQRRHSHRRTKFTGYAAAGVR
jgi:hypothetical protein